MRIAVMAHLAPPRHNAGAEVMLFSMLRPLAQRGHKVDVILSRPTPDTEPYDVGGVTVHPYRSRHDPIPYVHDCNLIVTHLENTLRADALSKVMRRPLAVICHNTMDWTRNHMDPAWRLVVFNSEWMRESFGSPANGIVVRPPVAVDEYRTKPGDRVTFVNLTATKGAGVFYALAERMPDVKFLGVVGAYGEQIIRTDLPNVEIAEHIPAWRMRDEVYSRTRVLLMPSDYESWGRVGVEAMCSGIPVIAHPTEGLTESLGDAGTFCDRNDIDSWERSLRHLLDGRHYRVASRKAKARAAELDPTTDLDRWVSAVEAIRGGVFCGA